jgi:hypothetical protein
MVTPTAKREAAAHLRTSFEVSERRACSVLGVDRTSVRYRSGRRTMPPCGAEQIPSRWTDAGFLNTLRHPLSSDRRPDRAGARPFSWANCRSGLSSFRPCLCRSLVSYDRIVQPLDRVDRSACAALSGVTPDKWAARG